MRSVFPAFPRGGLLRGKYTGYCNYSRFLKEEFYPLPPSLPLSTQTVKFVSTVYSFPPFRLQMLLDGAALWTVVNSIGTSLIVELVWCPLSDHTLS